MKEALLSQQRHPKKLIKCPKCPTGKMAVDDDDPHAKVCVNCGYKKTDNWARKRFFEEHKADIIADFKNGGVPLLEQKWRIKQATWNGLAGRWNVFGDPDPKTTKQVIEVRLEKAVARITVEVFSEV